jgi:hypothetical protein
MVIGSVDQSFKTEHSMSLFFFSGAGGHDEVGSTDGHDATKASPILSTFSAM